MDRPADDVETDGLFARLSRSRATNGIVMALERLWPRVLPFLLVTALFLILSWFGLFRVMPDWARTASLVLFSLGAVASLFPLISFRLPKRPEIDTRIEHANALLHRPVTTQNDRVTQSDDAFAATLWAEHQKRMADRLGDLRTAAPSTGIPARDPWGLRAAVGLMLVIAFAFSYGTSGGRLDDVFHSHAGSTAIPARIDAWVTPPAYTGRAPLFLTAEANRDEVLFTVPENSAVTVRITGGSGDETLGFKAIGTDDIEPLEPAAATGARAGGRQFAGLLDRDGVLELTSGGTNLQAWTFSVIPDMPPEISFTDEPKRALNGTLELAYTVKDDYGAASAEALIELKEKPAAGARPLYEAPEMGLSLPRRSARESDATTSQNLTEHPWAGSQATIVLRAVDDAGQEATSKTKALVLPQRPFTNPLAKAVIEHRRVLALDANRKSRVILLMDSVMLRADETFENPVHFLALQSARTRLTLADDDDELREMVDYLWEIALQIEDGDLSAAEKRLREAQQALREALENGASDEEIAQLMEELRSAMQEFLREFAERAMQNPETAMQMPNSQEMRQSDLDRMLDQLEDLARSGARDQAMDLLSQLENMMNNLQTAQRQQGQQGQQQSEMQQQLNELGELMRRQQEMMNETFRLDQMQRGNRQNGEQQNGQQGQQGEQGQQPGQGMTAEELAEALRQLQQGQGQLQSDLQALMEALEGMGMQPGEGFGEAGEAMGRAGEALGEADGSGATSNQGQALEALRQGAQDMMNQMQQAMQGGEGGTLPDGTRLGNADRDPLGRPQSTTGPDFGRSVEVPDEIDTQRARQILEAIRERLGNALSPAQEKDYLERLLDLQ